MELARPGYLAELRHFMRPRVPLLGVRELRAAHGVCRRVGLDCTRPGVLTNRICPDFAPHGASVGVAWAACRPLRCRGQQLGWHGPLVGPCGAGTSSWGGMGRLSALAVQGVSLAFRAAWVRKNALGTLGNVHPVSARAGKRPMAPCARPTLPLASVATVRDPFPYCGSAV